jgi:hypothetical protein
LFVGHYSAAFAAKAAVPRVRLWIFLLAAQFVDILWVTFVVAGVEHVRMVATLPSNPLDLYHMPYSHSLLATVFWSGFAFAGARFVLGLDRVAAGAVSLVVASHWFLDLLVHRRDSVHRREHVALHELARLGECSQVVVGLRSRSGAASNGHLVRPAPELALRSDHSGIRGILDDSLDRRAP